MAHDASLLERMPDHIIVHVLSLSMRAHPSTKALITPTLRPLLEGEELPRIRHETYVNGKLVGAPLPATMEEVRREHERVNRENEVILRFNKDERFDNGYDEPATSKAACIEPAQHFRDALSYKWGAVMSFSCTSRQNKSLARDARLWRDFEQDLQSAFPLPGLSDLDVPSIVRLLTAASAGAHEVTPWIDPRISSDAGTTAPRERTDPFVPGTMIEKFGLREGVLISGLVQPQRKQQGPRLREILDVDGMPPEDYVNVKQRKYE